MDNMDEKHNKSFTIQNSTWNGFTYTAEHHAVFARLTTGQCVALQSLEIDVSWYANEPREAYKWTWQKIIYINLWEFCIRFDCQEKHKKHLV